MHFSTVVISVLSAAGAIAAPHRDPRSVEANRSDERPVEVPDNLVDRADEALVEATRHGGDHGHEEKTKRQGTVLHHDQNGWNNDKRGNAKRVLPDWDEGKGQEKRQDGGLSGIGLGSDEEKEKRQDDGLSGIDPGTNGIIRISDRLSDEEKRQEGGMGGIGLGSHDDYESSTIWPPAPVTAIADHVRFVRPGGRQRRREVGKAGRAEFTRVFVGTWTRVVNWYCNIT